jgi:hypothetical protein
MSDCPVCDDWRYDVAAACVLARQVGDLFPVLWDGANLRAARGEEAPDHRVAVGAHMCFAHPMDPRVLLLGPVREYTPLAGINALLTAMAARPSSVFFGLRRKERRAVQAAMEISD